MEGNKGGRRGWEGGGYREGGGREGVTEELKEWMSERVNEGGCE